MKKSTRRKVWYAKGSGIEIAIQGATITSEVDLDKLRMLELSAISTFATGCATSVELAHVSGMMNLTKTMSTMGIGREALPACAALKAILVEIHQRMRVTGTAGATDSELEAMSEVYKFHEAQRKAVDRRTYERAITTCSNRVRSSRHAKKAVA